jgi:hypothetical protein
MFRKLRILLLLFVLFLVATGSWFEHARLTDWDAPVWAVVYPIAGDDSPITRDYLRRLHIDQLAVMERFLASEARSHGVAARQPLKVVLGPRLADLPPAPPAEASPLAVMLWSLRLRYWAWVNEQQDLLGDVSLFVIYHDPARSPTVPHSLGLKKGHIGVVHAFADHEMTQANNVVITHELLHTLGATDKYDLRTDLPLYPLGYADPERRPLYPQDQAEIMAGRIPLGAEAAAIPDSLAQTVVGKATAREIGW